MPKTNTTAAPVAEVSAAGPYEWSNEHLARRAAAENELGRELTPNEQIAIASALDYRGVNISTRVPQPGPIGDKTPEMVFAEAAQQQEDGFSPSVE